MNMVGRIGIAFLSGAGTLRGVCVKDVSVLPLMPEGAIVAPRLLLAPLAKWCFHTPIDCEDRSQHPGCDSKIRPYQATLSRKLTRIVSASQSAIVPSRVGSRTDAIAYPSPL